MFIGKQLLPVGLWAQTAEHPPLGADFPKEDFFAPVELETTDRMEWPELMSFAEIACLMELDAIHNPLLADLWWNDVRDDPVAP